MAKITAPSNEFTGKRGNVAFIDGVGETDDPAMLAYFRRHGYKVEDAEKSAPAKRVAAAKSAPAKGDGSEPSSD